MQRKNPRVRSFMPRCFKLLCKKWPFQCNRRALLCMVQVVAWLHPLHTSHWLRGCRSRTYTSARMEMAAMRANTGITVWQGEYVCSGLGGCGCGGNWECCVDNPANYPPEHQTPPRSQPGPSNLTALVTPRDKRKREHAYLGPDGVYYSSPSF